MTDPEKSHRGQRVENIGDPIQLKKFEVIGFSASNTKGGEDVAVQVAGAFTTLDPMFHKVAGGLKQVIEHAAHQSGKPAQIDRHNCVLPAVRPFR